MHPAQRMRSACSGRGKEPGTATQKRRPYPDEESGSLEWGNVLMARTVESLHRSRIVYLAAVAADRAPPGFA
jgi:hypothetical protein